MSGNSKTIDDKNTAVFLDTMTDQSVKYSLFPDDDLQSTDLYAEFLESFKIGACLVDANGLVEYVNKKGCELLANSVKKDLMGTEFSKYFELNEESEKEFFDLYCQRDWTPKPIKVSRPDGTTMSMLANITFSNSKPARVVTIFFYLE